MTRRFALAICLIAASAEAQQSGPHWVGAWGCAPQLTEPANLPPAPGLSGNTLRQIVRVTLGGKELRVRFSNLFGDGPLSVDSAQLAISAGGGAIQPGTGKRLKFRGFDSVTIPQGGETFSDTLDYDLPPMTDMAITIRFREVPAAVTGHPGSRSTSYLAAGNEVGAASLTQPAKAAHWYIVTGIDVMADGASASVAVLGDSLTDGRGSTTDGNDRWTDVLARRLYANERTALVTVLNEGLGGNTVLARGLGPPAVTRFDRDMLGQTAVRWLIVLEGVNDIGGNVSPNVAADLIAAYQQFIDKAHARGVRVYGVPILPFGKSMYDSPAHEAARQTVNQWIRTSGRFDAVIDMDAAVRDPETPSNLLPAYDTGDHLHLNPAGYRKMAEVIDLNLFAP
jgi:lysophospholipase L1-like esterase